MKDPIIDYWFGFQLIIRHNNDFFSNTPFQRAHCDERPVFFSLLTKQIADSICCLIRMRIIQYAHGPDRIHKVELHAYGLANFYTLNPLLTKSVKLPEQQTAEKIGQVSKPTKQQKKKMVKLREQQNSRTNWST